MLSFRKGLVLRDSGINILAARDTVMLSMIDSFFNVKKYPITSHIDNFKYVFIILSFESEKSHDQFSHGLHVYPLMRKDSLS